MDDSELLGYITNEERAALGYHTGELAAEREAALKYYLQQPLGNEVEGQSQVVDSSVRDTVEWMLPSLLKIFTASGKAVEFEPTGLEDVAAAKQATDACNYVFYKQNNGFLILYEWFKDALIEKNGIVKYYYEEKETKKKETYYGLTDEQMALLVQDDNVEVLAHSAYPDQMQASGPANPAMQMMVPPPNLHDVQIEVTEDRGKVCVHAVPPEEFRITSKHDSLSMQDCTFCEHVSRKTQSDLKEMGYSDKELEELGSEDDMADHSTEYLARRTFDEEQFTDDRQGPQRSIWCKEAYVRVDYDEDGISELRRVFIAGNKILENEETDHIPFAAISPIPMPHRFFGQSVAELVMDLQLIKTTLWRQILTNLYLTNNPRHSVLATQGGMAFANLDDLLTSRPGGIVRVYQPDAVQQLETKPVAAASFPMLEYLDQQRMNRSGVNQLSSGLDADAINKTARGAVLAQNQQAQKIELIARIFAETGVKDLFKGILRLLNKYSMKPMMIRMENQFVPVDPRNWDSEWDMTVTVGLGTGDKEQELVHLQYIGAAQEKMLAAGMGHIVTPENLYNTGKKIAECSGYKHPEEFFTAPSPDNPPPPPPPSDAMIKAQTDMQVAQMKMQADQQKSIGEASVEKLLKEIEAQAQIAVAQIQAQTQLAIKQMELAAESAMMDKKVRTDAELKIFDANTQVAVEQAKIEAQKEAELLKAEVAERDSVRQAEVQKEASRQQAKQLEQKSKEKPEKNDKKMPPINVNVSVGGKKKTTVIRDKDGNMTGAETVEE